jgi:hypothetical protein
MKLDRKKSVLTMFILMGVLALSSVAHAFSYNVAAGLEGGDVCVDEDTGNEVPMSNCE